MPTTNQLCKRRRVAQHRKSHSKRILGGNPQRKGIVLTTYVAEPKKPNSSNKKCARVRIIATGTDVSCYIPGEGHNLQEHSNVLIRHGNVADLPGVRFKIIRGVYDCLPADYSPKFECRRNQARSKYGAKKNAVSGNPKRR